MKFRMPIMMLAVSLSLPASAADKEEIVTVCRDGHLQARASIRQLDCEFEIRSPPGETVDPYTGKKVHRPAEVEHLTWLEDQDIARFSTTFGGTTQDYLWKDRTVKWLKPPLSAQTVSAKGLSSSNRIPYGSLDGPNALDGAPTAWSAALFYRPEKLREFMNSRKVVSAGEEMQGGQRLYRVTVDHWATFREDIFFDPRRNYVVAKTVGYPLMPDLASHHIMEVSRFTEPKPRIYFPESIKHIFVQKGKVEEQETRVFLKVRVNEPVDAGKLQLTFPAGTRVTDVRRGKVYTVGENEQPITPETQMAKPRDLDAERLYPTAMQPRAPWVATTLWTIACVAVLGTLMAILVRRALRGTL